MARRVREGREGNQTGCAPGKLRMDTLNGREGEGRGGVEMICSYIVFDDNKVNMTMKPEKIYRKKIRWDKPVIKIGLD